MEEKCTATAADASAEISTVSSESGEGPGLRETPPVPHSPNLGGPRRAEVTKPNRN